MCFSYAALAYFAVNRWLWRRRRGKKARREERERRKDCLVVASTRPFSGL